MKRVGKMIICIAGYTGSGKDTVADILAKRLNLPRVRLTFKDMARERGMTLMEFQKLASNDGGRIDREFDKRVAEEVQRLNDEFGGCVVSTWIAAWMIKDADFRVFLKASEEVRAQRVMKRDNLSFDDALAFIREKDRNNIERYKRYYGIDITDLSLFDLVIDTEHRKPEEIAEIIMRGIERKRKDDTALIPD